MAEAAEAEEETEVLEVREGSSRVEREIEEGTAEEAGVVWETISAVVVMPRQVTRAGDILLLVNILKISLSLGLFPTISP